MRYILAITGASGVIYGLSLLKELLLRQKEVHLIFSNAACLVLEHEMAWDLTPWHIFNLKKYLESELGFFPEKSLHIYAEEQITAPIASGSFICEAMIVVPCSMSSLAALANGISDNLIERAADVMLKEKRKLLIVPRETPLSSIHLSNMLKLSKIGAHIIPAMPAFYQQPQSVQDMVDFIVGKIMDALHLEHDLFKRYSG